MEPPNSSKESNPIFKMKPFSELTKKQELIKIESKSRRSPIEDIVRHSHDEQDRETAKHLFHSSYADAIKFGVSSEIPQNQEKNKEEILKKAYSEMDKNAEESIPAITEKREDSLDDVYERKIERELPTMENERESIVEEEYKWEKEHGMVPNPEKKPDLFDLHEVIKYIDQHRIILEHGLSEADKKRLKIVMEATKDFKTICEETIHHFRDDLIDFYQKTKRKFSDAFSEITDQ